MEKPILHGVNNKDILIYIIKLKNSKKLYVKTTLKYIFKKYLQKTLKINLVFFWEILILFLNDGISLVLILSI